MRERLPAPSPSLDFPGGCGTVVWPGWSSVGIKEDVQGVSAAVLVGGMIMVAMCDPGGRDDPGGSDAPSLRSGDSRAPEKFCDGGPACSVKLFPSPLAKMTSLSPHFW